MQGVKLGEAEIEFSEVPDVQPSLGVAGVLADKSVPGTLSVVLGVHGELKFSSDALGVAEYSDSLAEGLVTSATIIWSRISR